MSLDWRRSSDRLLNDLPPRATIMQTRFIQNTRNEEVAPCCGDNRTLAPSIENAVHLVGLECRSKAGANHRPSAVYLPRCRPPCQNDTTSHISLSLTIGCNENNCDTGGVHLTMHVAPIDHENALIDEHRAYRFSVHFSFHLFEAAMATENVP